MLRVVSGQASVGLFVPGLEKVPPSCDGATGVSVFLWSSANLKGLAGGCVSKRYKVASVLGIAS